jgi:DNA helicase-2/ATP-dependent DNA helicase PcrA
LPELGVELVKQTTFEDFAVEVIGDKFKIRDIYEKLLELIKPEADEAHQYKQRLWKEAAEFKSSLLYKEILDGYLQQIESSLLLKGDFSFKGRLLFSEKEIRELFYVDYREWPYYGRIEQIKKHFFKRLKERKEDLVFKLQNDCNLKVERIKFRMAETEERQRLIIKTIDEKNEAVRELENFIKKGIKDYFKQIPVKSAFQYYKEFLAEQGFFENQTQHKPGYSCLSGYR